MTDSYRKSKEDIDPHATDEVPGLLDLPTSIQPDRDLWAGTRLRLEDHNGSARYSRWVLAAGVVASLAGAVWWSSAGDRSSSPELTEPSAAILEGSAQLARHEDRVLPVRKELARAAALQLNHLESRDHAAIVASVEALDVAIGQIRLALAQRPDDASLNRLLAATYLKEAGLTKRLQQI